VEVTREGNELALLGYAHETAYEEAAAIVLRSLDL
jgi:hypothetical protein